MADQSRQSWPTELRYDQASRVLHAAFEDGRTYDYPAEFLRVHSPSAEVKGHGPGQEKLVHGRRHVGIMRIEPVGNYAVRLVFDDLHDTGIYTWRYLAEIGDRQEEMWEHYVSRLDAASLTREP